jgi:hypothetical protein
VTRDIRGFVVHHMLGIRAIVNSDTAQTRAIFAKHIDKITLTRTGYTTRRKELGIL